jgi:hypothetical protein
VRVFFFFFFFSSSSFADRGKEEDLTLPPAAGPSLSREGGRG